MTVKEEDGLYPTDRLVSTRARKHYKTPVKSQHWQLRSLVSAENRHFIYFPGGNGSNHVVRLNTATHQCETIKLLTFAPRCLVAKNGWLCCGSETGEFVAMRLHENQEPNDAEPSSELDFDGSNPFTESSRESTILSLLARVRRSSKSLVAKSMKLARDRVNCITLWFPSTSTLDSEAAYRVPVAVLANNDRTVTFVNLEDFEQNDQTEPIDIINYPDFVNRAIISPDGQLLISILDDPYLYVHKRVERPDKNATPPSSISASFKREFHWEPVRRLLLKSQRKDDRSDNRGSFAACFSESGAYLAVGTQHGTVSVFNALLLSTSSADPLITTFQSSRPESGPGAIRDMAFCPGPFDILAWTEDRDHVGFADMRTGFAARQIVKLKDRADTDMIAVTDQNTIDPRLLDSHSARRETERQATPSGGTETPDPQRRALFEGLNHPLTPNEMMVLEAIQNDRRRRTRIRPPGDERPSGGPFMWSRRSRPIPVDTESPTERDYNNDNDNNSEPSFEGRTIEEYMDIWRDQDDDSAPLDRVRTAHGARGIDAETSSTSLRRPQRTISSRTPEQRWMERMGEMVREQHERMAAQRGGVEGREARLREVIERQTAQRQQRQRAGDSHEPYDASYFSLLEIIRSRERSGNEGEADTSLLMPLVNQVMNRWEENMIRSNMPPDHGVFEVPPSPDNTAGLSWSDDGRILYVGAQDGIYEIHVNVVSRKFCSAISMR